MKADTIEGICRAVRIACTWKLANGISINRQDAAYCTTQTLIIPFQGAPVLHAQHNERIHALVVDVRDAIVFMSSNNRHVYCGLLLVPALCKDELRETNFELYELVEHHCGFLGLEEPTWRYESPLFGFPRSY